MLVGIFLDSFCIKSNDFTWNAMSVKYACGFWCLVIAEAVPDWDFDVLNETIVKNTLVVFIHTFSRFCKQVISIFLWCHSWRLDAKKDRCAVSESAFGGCKFLIKQFINSGKECSSLRDLGFSLRTERANGGTQSSTQMRLVVHRDRVEHLWTCNGIFALYWPSDRR